jgi:hypothetical protein
VTVENFSALHTGDVSGLQAALTAAALLAVPVVPKYFEAVAAQLRDLILKRFDELGPAPLDILLCTNLIHAGPKFRELLMAGLSGPERDLMDANVGIVETLIIRISPDAAGQVPEAHPLAVLTNGYPIHPVDRGGFKGEPLRSPHCAWSKTCAPKKFARFIRTICAMPCFHTTALSTATNCWSSVWPIPI